MAPEGPELIVGAVGDPAFGPLVACGAGGVAAELLGDIQVRIAPLGPREADGMLRDLKTFPLLDGYRGRPRADLGAVRDLVMRVGALVAAHPAVAELDLDPVIATPDGRARRQRSRPGRRPGPRGVVPFAQRLIAGTGGASSPASSRSRSSNFGTLPVDVLGNSSRKSTALGALKWAMMDRT